MEVAPLPSDEVKRLDSLLAYEVPEGVRMHIRLAGPVVRACAWAIDALIRGVLYIALSVTFSLLGGVGTAIILIGFFLIEWFYPVIFEIYSGATPGKRAMKILVIQDNGVPIGPAASVIRNLLRVVDFLPFFYAAGLLSMLLNREFKRLGDLAAGTLVVYLEPTVKRQAAPSATILQPPAELIWNEQETLLAFAERSQQLSAARRVELAELLSEITNKRAGQAVDTLYGYANWIMRGP